jgi:hypothetical protein
MSEEDTLYYIIFTDSCFGYINNLKLYAEQQALFFGTIREIEHTKLFLPAVLNQNDAFRISERMSINNLIHQSEEKESEPHVIPLLGNIIVGYKLNKKLKIGKKSLTESVDKNIKKKEYTLFTTTDDDIVIYNKNGISRALIFESAFEYLIPTIACYYIKTTADKHQMISFFKSVNCNIGLTPENTKLMDYLSQHPNEFVSIRPPEEEIPKLKESEIPIEIKHGGWKDKYLRQKRKYIDLKKYFIANKIM